MVSLILEQKIERWRGVLARSRKHVHGAAALALLVAAGGVVIALCKARTYRSEAMLLYHEAVDRNRLTRDGQENPDVYGDLKKLLWSRTAMLRMIDELQLYRELRGSRTPEQVFAHLQKQLELRSRGGDTFWLSFEHGDPRMAQRVVQTVTRYLIESYDARRDKQLKETALFLAQSVERGRGRVTDLEQRIGQFVQRHGARVASEQGTISVGARALSFYKGATNRAGLRPATPEIREAQRERGRLAALLQVALGPATVPAEPPPPPSALAEELAGAQRELERKQVELTDRHPDVVHLKRQVARLQASQPRAVQARLLAPSSDPRVTALQEQLRAIDDRIERLERAPAQITPAPRAPESETVESEWARLNREYTIATSELEELESVGRRADLLIGGALTGRRFEIRDPAFLPRSPIRPSRKKIAGLGMLIGLAMGVTYLALRLQLDPTIYDASDLQLVSSLPVLAVIPTKHWRSHEG